MIIGVTGCVAQERKDWLFSRAPYLDLVLGTDAVARLPEKVKELQAGAKRITDTAVFKPKDDPFLLQAKPTRARVGEFVTEDFYVHRDARVSIEDAFHRWRERGEQRGEYIGTSRWLVQQLLARGFTRMRLSGGTKGLSGLSLKPRPSAARLPYADN